MIRLQFSMLFILILTLVSCVEPEMNESIEDDRFPLGEFMDQEIQKVEGKTLVVEKTIQQNEIIEKNTESNQEWIDMLNYFKKSGFNKPSSSGLYEIDTVSQDLKMIITYRSMNDNINPKNAEVTYLGEDVFKINYILEEKNLLFEKIESRTFWPDSLIHIERSQSVRFLNESRTSIISKLQ